jgi:membrane protease YdiL (CAAX protease family)
MVGRIIGAFLFVFVFNGIALAVLLLLPPFRGLFWVLLLGGGFLWWHLRRDANWRRRHALIRLRPPRASPVLVTLTCASTLLLVFGLAGLLLPYAPVRLESDRFWGPVLTYQSTPGGWIVMAILMVVVVPIVEEFFFRGRIQHTLERRYGPYWAIGVASVLFLVGHFDGRGWPILLISLMLGVANGVVVYLFGSIWVAVAIHGLWNGLMSLPMTLAPSPTSTSGDIESGYLLPLSIVLGALGVVGWALILRTGPARLRRSISASKGFSPSPP